MSGKLIHTLLTGTAPTALTAIAVAAEVAESVGVTITTPTPHLENGRLASVAAWLTCAATALGLIA